MAGARVVARGLPTQGLVLIAAPEADDAINAFAGAERFMCYSPNAQLLRSEGLGQRKIVEDADTHSRVLQFLMRLV